jgi:hypothetical protein
VGEDQSVRPVSALPAPSAKTASWRLPLVHRAHLERVLWVEGGRSGRREEGSVRADRRLSSRLWAAARERSRRAPRSSREKMSQIAAAY